MGPLIDPDLMPWDILALGNHRTLVQVLEPGKPALVRFPYHLPEGLSVGHARVERLATREVVQSAPAGADSVLFATLPAEGPEAYAVYWLPYELEGTYYPKVHYPAGDPTFDVAWRDAALADPGCLSTTVGELEVESPDHHDFTDADIPAGPAQVAALRAAGKPCVYGSGPQLALRSPYWLPLWCVEQGPGCAAGGAGIAGGYAAFQVVVYAAGEAVGPVRLSLQEGSALTDFRCLNTGGVDYTGRPFQRDVVVPSGELRAFWCVVSAPESAAGLLQAATVEVEWPGGGAAVPLGVFFTRHQSQVEERRLLSRLAWLDSRLGDDDTVPAPYTPVSVSGSRIGILGRHLDLGEQGLPAAIHCDLGRPVDVLAGPVRLEALDTAGEAIRWEGGPVQWTGSGHSFASWAWRGTAPGLVMDISGTLEFDGAVMMECRLRADREVDLADVALEMELPAEVATHFMGLGHQGGRRPDRVAWHWDPEFNQDSLWIGCPAAGVQLALRDDGYVRPLNTNFYHEKPLVMPRSWANGDRGGITVDGADAKVRIRCHSGARTMSPGEMLAYDFRLIITPTRPLDTATHFTRRYCHAYKPVDEVAALGANVINVHHANAVNPYINYPFIRMNAMKAYIDEAHSRGIRVKIYYTVRELTTRADETWALLSLGGEVFAEGSGGGWSWIREHVGWPCLPGWFAPNVEDSSLVTAGMSRWHNYYVEGLDLLAREVGIDGLYLDDVAFDRHVMKRVRRVLCRHLAEPLIDLHSANQHNERDGFSNSANLYLELMPYIDRLWFGEYFDYDSDPDRWLVEMSGIPFGLLGEMLENGGNPWRGILFGMTNRAGWSTDVDPRPVWRLLDRFGMEGAVLHGWWEPGCPARTDHPDVRVTVYSKPGAALLAVASWAQGDVRCRLSVDWDRLGLDPGQASLVAHESEGFQPGERFALDEPLIVPEGRGWLLSVEAP